jgi:NAD(P)-dependent dehydrogenase (short-subunit alcohol dehydrogenase family)
MPQRNWLITGVSSGFGRIMTEQLLARGDRVAGTVRDLSVMNKLKAEHGDWLWLAELDLSKTASIRGAVNRIADRRRTCDRTRNGAIAHGDDARAAQDPSCGSPSVR